MSLIDNAGTTEGDKGSSEGGKAPTEGEKGASSQTPPAGNQDSQVIDHSKDAWFYDDGKPGEGTRPDWLLPKFKTAAEQARSFSEAEKRLGAFKGAPDAYDLKIADMPDVEFHPDDPFIKDFLDDAKKNNVSQEYVSQLLGTYVKMQRANMPNPDKEMEKLGPSAKQDLQVLAQWGNNSLTKEEFVVFKNMMTTADGVRLFQKLRTLSTGPDKQPSNPNTQRETEAEVRKLIHDPRFETDEKFRNEVREKLAAFG